MVKNLIAKLCIITVLMAVTVICLFSKPARDTASWVAVFSWSKFVGIAAGYAMIRLTRRWLGPLVNHIK